MMRCGRRQGEIGNVSTLLRQGPIGDLSDRQLLARFASRDGSAAESAFAALVERHGPMVLRTCRSILRDGHDAHDAFQATFLVLARRAGSAWSGDSVAAWLHQVARRTALCARSASARRRRHEARAAALTPASSPDPPQDDLGEALHAEIARLPDRYRAAVVLCLLEGYTHDQAARQLDVPVGTLQSRLSRGRERLRARLARRGLAPSVAPSALLVPPSWIDLTAHAASRFAAGPSQAGMASATVLSLAQEVCQMMMTSKLKLIGAAVLGIGLGVSGLGAWAQQGEAGPDRPAAPTGANPHAGDRMTIVLEKRDSAGKYTVSERITTQLDESGQWAIVSETRKGKHPGSMTINCKVARFQIEANALAGPGVDPFQIAVSTMGPGATVVGPRRTLPEEPAQNDLPRPTAKKRITRTLAPISSDSAADPATSRRAELYGRVRSVPAGADAPDASRPAASPNPETRLEADSITVTLPTPKPARRPASAESIGPGPDGPLIPAPSGVEASPSPISPPPPASSSIHRPRLPVPIVPPPGGPDLAPISDSPPVSNAASLPGSAFGKVREPASPPIEDARPARTEGPPTDLKPLSPETPDSFPPGHDPLNENYRARIAQDRRMDEMERKLDLILQRLDGPKVAPH